MKVQVNVLFFNTINIIYMYTTKKEKKVFGGIYLQVIFKAYNLNMVPY